MSYYFPIVAALVTFLSVAAILSSRFGKKIQDIPNERSLHTKPIPRIGGVGLMFGVLSAWGLMFDTLEWWVVLPLVVLFGVSLLDDMHNLPVRVRFVVHLGAGAVLIEGSGLHVEYGILLAILGILFTVWLANLYNFMDGSDGLAGGMALFGFAFYGIAALVAHNNTLAMLNFSISGAALGFLCLNFPPARVFMGDAGSVPLGFLAAAMGLTGWQQGSWELWYPLLVFSPFIVDASVTLIKRSLRGVKITEAHREHYYQRAIQMGWSHRQVALAEYGLMLGAGLVALLFTGQRFPVLAFLLWGGIYSAVMFALDGAWKKFKGDGHA
jgi:UDP-N-acetylmuramyl pentapeptide phosphotransferase/UDP-N-acetylglucosamine-1-phosphate transferase